MRNAMRSRWLHHTLIASLLFSSPLFVQAALGATTASDYRALGLRYRQQGQFTEAIAALQKAVELDPDSLSSRVLLGWTLHLAEQDRDAADVLQKAVQRDATDIPALNALGIVYLVNDDPIAAALTHAWAAWLKPDNEIAYYNLSLALERLEHYDWAIDTAEKAAELEPNNPHPLVALAIAQWQNGEKDIAKESYQRAIDLDGRYHSSSFLNGLDKSGFSQTQIEKSKQVLRTLL